MTIASTLVLLSIYAVWHPTSPDLVAQIARADVVRAAGRVGWWTGWFGGLSLPTYSVIAPWAMAHIGVHLTGALAVLTGSVAGSVLARDARRPMAASLAYSVACIADLLAGRVTFAAGVAIATWSLVALRSRRSVLASALGVAAFLTSPLAALFLGIVAAAVLLTDPRRRLAAGVLAACVLGSAVTMALLFPGTGTMPFNIRGVLACGACCGVLYVTCKNRVIRCAAILIAGTLVVLLIVPGAVGSNIARMLWLCAAPAAAGFTDLDRRGAIALVAALSLWPGVDLAMQLTTAHTPSSSAAFYRPLLDELATEHTAAGERAIGERVEVLDTATHWASVYVAEHVAIARGWDRQADIADNPLFYQPGELTAASYRTWLQQLAVGWIALPHARLDSASMAEAALVTRGVPYLRPIWSSRDWTLYRVADPQPLATGATVTGVSPGGVTLQTHGPGIVQIQIRYTRYLTVLDAGTGQPVPACVADNAGWTVISLPARGTYTLTDAFDSASFAERTGACTRP